MDSTLPLALTPGRRAFDACPRLLRTTALLLLAAACGCSPCGERLEEVALQVPLVTKSVSTTASGFDESISTPVRPFPTFVDRAPATGMTQVLHAGRPAKKHWILETVGAGAVAFDYDDDGDIDVLILDGAAMNDVGELETVDGARTRLWRNDGDWRFVDVTAASGIDVTGFAVAGAAADFDGDGHVDVAIGGYDHLSLWRNRGDGTFTSCAPAAGLTPPRYDFTCGLAWGDLDGDGRVDLFQANYLELRAHVEDRRREERSGLSCNWRKQTVYCGPQGLSPQANRVWLQREPGKFSTTPDSIRGAIGGYSFQPVLSDFDGDGDLDVYVANDSDGNHLLVNDGRGQLVNRGLESGSALNVTAKAMGSMGVSVADYDEDGRPDLFVTNFAREHHSLYRNLSRNADTPLFQDASLRSGISRAPDPRVGWGAGLRDFDNDGVLDVFFACGHAYDEDKSDNSSTSQFKQRLQMYRGRRVGRRVDFVDVTSSAGEPFREDRAWRGACFADFDNDGDLDVLATALHAPPALLSNEGGSDGAWIRFDLRGAAPNTSAAGASVVLELASGRRLLREIQLGDSHASCSDPRLLFGLPGADWVEAATVRWPDGRRTRLARPAIRATHRVVQDTLMARPASGR